MIQFARLLEGEEEVDEGGAFIEVELLAQAVACTLHTSHAELGKLGDVFGGEVKAQLDGRCRLYRQPHAPR